MLPIFYDFSGGVTAGSYPDIPPGCHWGLAIFRPRRRVWQRGSIKGREAAPRVPSKVGEGGGRWNRRWNYGVSGSHAPAACALATDQGTRGAASLPFASGHPEPARGNQGVRRPTEVPGLRPVRKVTRG